MQSAPAELARDVDTHKQSRRGYVRTYVFFLDEDKTQQYKTGLTCCLLLPSSAPCPMALGSQKIWLLALQKRGKRIRTNTCLYTVDTRRIVRSEYLYMIIIYKYIPGMKKYDVLHLSLWSCCCSLSINGATLRTDGRRWERRRRRVDHRFDSPSYSGIKQVRRTAQLCAYRLSMMRNAAAAATTTAALSLAQRTVWCLALSFPMPTSMHTQRTKSRWEGNLHGCK